jgi:hypothetical protein
LTPQFEFSINGPEFSSIDDVWGFRAGADSTPSFHEHMGDTSEPPKLFASIPSKRREGIAASVVATRMLRSYPDMMLQRTHFRRSFIIDSMRWELNGDYQEHLLML